MAMDHLPDMENIFNVFFNDDLWWQWVLKVGLYPWVLASKLVDIVFINYLANPLYDNMIGLESAYGMAQIMGLWLVAPVLINLYIGTWMLFVKFMEWGE